MTPGDTAAPVHQGPPRPPPIGARHLVTLATRFLPAGSTRQRYRQELLAELYGLPARQATRCAIGIAINAPALRAAVTADGQHPTEVTMHTHRPLACRLNIHHHYRIQHAEDGGRYWHCPRCGKDYFRNTHPGGGSFMAAGGG
jgi:hypothetical protein